MSPLCNIPPVEGLGEVFNGHLMAINGEPNCYLLTINGFSVRNYLFTWKRVLPVVKKSTI